MMYARYRNRQGRGIVLLLIVSMLLLTLGQTFRRSSSVAALNNGLALKPPMGWNSWNRFGCNINETMIKQMADAMVSSGMAAAGYEYVNLDDCWQLLGRDANGHVRPDPVRFPSGMKALGDYIHAKGLKFGIYSDRGTRTCAGREGSYMYETIDARDYAAWGVDMVKYDNCYPAAGSNQQADYTRMRDALAASGRPIVFSICAWGFASWMPATGNLWRTTGDILDSWSSITGIIDQNGPLAYAAGPSAWNDPDMLMVGNYGTGAIAGGGMTDTEYRSHFSMWAIMAAPLIAGNDLRSMNQATRDILLNTEVIAVDQDALGRQGTKVRDFGDQEVWSKTLQQTGARAVALFNRGSGTANITVNWSDIGLSAGSATVRDLWARADRGSFNNSYTASVPAHGTVMLKIVGAASTVTPTPSTTTPKVVISNTDTRVISNLKVTVDFTINGARHQDSELQGTFDRTINDGLNATGGTLNGGIWTGNFLTTQSTAAGSKVLTINKVDTRPINGLRISVEFTINGALHTDYEDVGDFTGQINLVLNGSSGTWDGSKWTGNFLRR